MEEVMLLLWLSMALSMWAHSTLLLSPFDQTKLESFFAMVVYLAGGYSARHLTWKWVYCNNVFVLLAKHFHEWWKGVIGKLGWMCVMSLLNHILCVWNMWAPIKRPTRQRGVCLSCLHCHTHGSWGLWWWKISVGNYKAILKEMLST